ncbi:phosphoserine phosphatase SerB [Novosphingobium aquiterrae]|uniref:Phosphoserine phosphatase n=1 Tax=Novosphingobium aquiterrae TaxID=624388 RepID=A0ABV6PIW8_9SPHN
MLIARVIAEPDHLSASLDRAAAAIAAAGMQLAGAEMLSFCDTTLQLELVGGDAAMLGTIIDECFGPCDRLIADHEPQVPHLFVSDMDSTMIGQECIDELADYAGIKPQIAAITERAMQGELDFSAALRERVMLLQGLSVDAIADCLATRITPMAGARTLVATLKAHGCRTVLVTGGFHHFADPVARQLGFERVVGNRLAVEEERLTGGLVGAITDSTVKQQVLRAEAAEIGGHAVSLATGDGANDIPMLEAATYGIAYRAKPKARAAADGTIDRGDLTDVLRLLGIPRDQWVLG